MTASPSKYRQHDAVRRKVRDQRFDRSGLDQRMVHQKQQSSRNITTQPANAGLERSDHSLLVIWIENDPRGLFHDRLDLGTVMTDDDDRIFYRRIRDRIKNVCQEGPATKR